MIAPLGIIVIAQLLGTSLWFTPNGVAGALMSDWGLSLDQLGYLTSAVQLGFISGTLVIAFSGFADRYRASHVFATSAVLGALCNALFLWSESSFSSALCWRFLTGVSLAGIYPLGMKLVVSWVPNKTGHALGWLVGMLTLGSSLPHAMRGISDGAHWQWVVLGASVFALISAVMIYWLGDGEHLPARAPTMMRGKALQAFKIPAFRAAAIAYFGHCWELYAFWTLVPVIVFSILEEAAWSFSLVPWLSFIIVAVGMPACLIAGLASREWGSAITAYLMLLSSGVICLIWPFVAQGPIILVLIVLLLWGMTVIADSAQYSALAAASCPKEYLGSALALMNSIGFLMTVFSITLTTVLYAYIGDYVAWLMLAGPLVGLWVMKELLQSDPTR
ncbi:MFS transporter [Neptunomonas qingdaonensis]|uniref:Predicted arabinose efflux permease, MFS family n=1 Tax=Neptunomonas qingdaonensis TaxID=1045558 RepID=A0A1I2Q3D4_9GAMM|nr:MFS transporter [Neptunomonas qingdaonensis]SFG22892.1 Predicted arabinose efflux permease, MFS family [Neptunomonas qingdaonensis]